MNTLSGRPAPQTRPTHDEFGFSYEVETLYNDSCNTPAPAQVKLCGHCRLPGHTIRTCKALNVGEQPCLHTPWLAFIMCNSLPMETWRDEEGNKHMPCMCQHCMTYRSYNWPNPKTASYIYQAKKKDKMHPQVTLVNKTNAPIYIYDEEMDLTATMEENGISTIRDEMEPFAREEVANFIVLNQLYSNSWVAPTPESVDPKHILKLFTITYGTKQTLTITDKNTTQEDKWKEAALKSLYLLQQLERLGVHNNPNYEPILYLFQYIDFPIYD
jgi:hypothetical protein